MRARLPIAMVMLITVASHPCLAQASDQMGASRDHVSGAKASSRTRTGQRVPSPSALGPNETGSIQRRTPSDQRNDAISRGICIGCSPR